MEDNNYARDSFIGIVFTVGATFFIWDWAVALLFLGIALFIEAQIRRFIGAGLLELKLKYGKKEK